MLDARTNVSRSAKPTITLTMNRKTFGRGMAMNYEIFKAFMQALEWGEDFCAVIRYSAEAEEAELMIFNQDQSEKLSLIRSNPEPRTHPDSPIPSGS